MNLRNPWIWTVVLIVGGWCRAATAAEAKAGDAVDHAGIIRSWDAASFKRGEKLYQAVCVTCHGTPERVGSLPSSRPFWLEPFKNGNDPHNIYLTITTGLGQMPAWPWLTPELRYDVVHYIREAFVKPLNPAAYFRVTDAYLERLPKGTVRQGEKSAMMLEWEKGPKYLRMDFGPVLFWTLEVAPGNIAYKGIAIRLDDGPGGISRGRAWMLYDHDTLRAAAAWTGEGFIDWKGIAFDGAHAVHSSIVGERLFVNPVGPGWARPGTGEWGDSRFRGLDGKPYGPLPREWAHYEGVYLHGNRVVVAYQVGDARVLESPRLEQGGAMPIVSRTLQVSGTRQGLAMRVAPVAVPVALAGTNTAGVELVEAEGFRVLRIPARPEPVRLKVLVGASTGADPQSALQVFSLVVDPAEDLEPLTHGGPARWPREVVTRGKRGTDSGPFAVDELTVPNMEANPWNAWLRPGGFDFLPGGGAAVVGMWNGDVWRVDGVDGGLERLVWRRIATGLFQPLGVKVVDGVVHVTCRDQIARLRDLNGDGEIDLVENFNNDHQVTEHFHEFAMGLQTDAEGNFYYAKSARHALPPLVPHHGTLLKVSRDGSRTEIVASGFRAANGVCVNGDGSFFVTDQEGHWTPKNRINRVEPGRFYGNMWAYHHPESAADEAMAPPLVWITNDMDRSPGELVWVTSRQWGPLTGGLLNLSYGTGRIFLVPHERVGDVLQGGVVQLPLPDLPTGVMRGRFHPGNGQLYACGLFGWAGNRTEDGGFFRVRRTERPLYLPAGLQATAHGVRLRFTGALDRQSASRVENYKIQVWGLRRTENYGSRHVNQRKLEVRRATLSDDGSTVELEIPELRPTWCMEIVCEVQAADGSPVRVVVHNTIHRLAEDTGGEGGARN